MCCLSGQPGGRARDQLHMGLQMLQRHMGLQMLQRHMGLQMLQMLQLQQQARSGS